MTRLALAALAASLLLAVPSALASHTPAPTSVTVAGSLQSELGCSGDWQPDCAATHLAVDADDGVWQRAFDVPAGSWEYKAPLNNAWDENYGGGAVPNGPNIALNLAANVNVKFYYDHGTHWITDNVNSTIAVAPGSFQSELGCPADWSPDCLRSWLQDPDGDGTYRFATTSIPAGNYEAKVALNESWDVNYGAGGVLNGPNIPFTVPANAETTFSYNGSTHVLTISSVSAGPGPDNNVEWDGVRHDSRDLLYRTPGGAVPSGTPVKLRLRTVHDDVTAVTARIFDVNANAQRLLPMEIAAADVSCYQGGLGAATCDFWEVTLPNGAANNLWYRFVVTDGTDTDYYADNTPALDGGFGATTDGPVDQSYALTVYEPGFRSPAWARDAVIYQIFPDRFRNGSAANDPKTGDPRYDEPVVAYPWSALPEGHCRNYTSPPCGEGPRGRDYFGGDLDGVIKHLRDLRDLGVTAIYFNPIFEAKSNHRYDTADYTRIDPNLGTLKEFERLVDRARGLGIRVILDGVFNHMSSDSPFFDRYHHYETAGACESLTSPHRAWFSFRNPNVPCGTGDYEGWFGFDSIPVLTKTLPAVQQYFLHAGNSISRLWLDRGASGWRMDVSGDPSFPDGYWEAFRQIVKSENPNVFTISETWQKDTALLRALRGDRFDTTMNYRFRDAVIGLLAPQGFDSKGFADSGRQLRPSEFAARMLSTREDYPDAAFFTAMNLLDSHDTERVLWALTPGADTRAAKEQDAASLAAGKRNVRIASLLQFTLPGAPTIYYGDEVGLTGDDDPDNRRTYPWPALGGDPDRALQQHYTTLASIRHKSDVLRTGDLRVLLADDDAETLAYARKTGAQAALVALNRSGVERTLDLSLGGYLPDGAAFARRYAVGAAGEGATVAGGVLRLTLGPRSAAVYLASGDFEPPAAPAGLRVTGDGDGTASLAWNAVTGAASYDVYRSPLSGGGWVKANTAPLTVTTFTATGLPNARTVYFVVRALDEHGNASGPSNEVSAMPHLTIGWANLQWPPSMTHEVSTTDRTDDAYGQVWIDGVTNRPGPTESLRAQLGFGPDGSNPDGNAAWTWTEARFNVDAGNNDEFVASMLPTADGTYDYAYRYTTTGGRDWVYADLDGIQNGYSPAQAGSLVVTVTDTTPPVAPAGLRVVSASPGAVELAWDAVTGDPTLYGYEVLRGTASGGPYTALGIVTATTFVDATVAEGGTYYYVVRSVDGSFNRSPSSSEVSATAAVRTVSVVFAVTVPATTDPRSVYIAGSLNRLDGGLPEWNPAGVVLTRVDATHWTITLTGKEGTQIEYKYVLGDWNFVEKDASCGEIANRQLTLAWGTNGTQTVDDAVPNWRNVPPCGN
jgi:glycosidase